MRTSEEIMVELQESTDKCRKYVGRPLEYVLWGEEGHSLEEMRELVRNQELFKEYMSAVNKETKDKIILN